MSRFLFILDHNARTSRRELSGALLCEWAAVTAVGKGRSPEAPGSWTGHPQQDVHSCRPWGCVCLLWDSDASGGLTCRSQARRMVTVTCLLLRCFFSLLWGWLTSKPVSPRLLKALPTPRVLACSRGTGVSGERQQMPRVCLLSGAGGKGTV